jgi:hypothetical protein
MYRACSVFLWDDVWMQRYRACQVMTNISLSSSRITLIIGVAYKAARQSVLHEAVRPYSHHLFHTKGAGYEVRCLQTVSSLCFANGKSRRFCAIILREDSNTFPSPDS